MLQGLHFYIETFGCQMNKGDSDLMHRSLVESGCVETKNIGEADIAIYNTCSVREHAEQRATAIITANNKHIRKNRGITVVAGCMAQRLGEELITGGIADIVIGPYQSPAAGSIIGRYLDSGGSPVFLSQSKEDLAERLHDNGEDHSWHRWVTISHGCDNRCSYCIVPAVRGGLVSFPSSAIQKHLEDLAARGIKEITLLGQNVNQYGIDSGDVPFHELLERTAHIRGFDRVNFMTSHPKDFTRDIISVIKNNETISRSVHLPLQSGSDRILSLMNRGYGMTDYHRIIEQLRGELDNFSLSTDLIVGFPGETRGEFEETLDAVRSIRFDDAFMYAYSRRDGTPAASLDDSCGSDEKKNRLMELIDIQRGISGEKLKLQISRIEKTTIERISKKSSRSVMGKTFLNHPVVLPGSENDIGKTMHVRIQGLKGSTLQGERIA